MAHRHARPVIREPGELVGAVERGLRPVAKRDAFRERLVPVAERRAERFRVSALLAGLVGLGVRGGHPQHLLPLEASLGVRKFLLLGGEAVQPGRCHLHLVPRLLDYKIRPRGRLGVHPLRGRWCAFVAEKAGGAHVAWPGRLGDIRQFHDVFDVNFLRSRKGLCGLLTQLVPLPSRVPRHVAGKGGTPRRRARACVNAAPGPRRRLTQPRCHGALTRPRQLQRRLIRQAGPRGRARELRDAAGRLRGRGFGARRELL